MVNGHSEILNETSRCEIEAGRNRLLVSRCLSKRARRNKSRWEKLLGQDSHAR